MGGGKPDAVGGARAELSSPGDASGRMATQGATGDHARESEL